MAIDTNVLGTFSPEDVQVILSSGTFVHVVNGFADGTFISVERKVPASELYIGSDLSNFRVKRKNRSAEVTLTLHQAAISNSVLSQLQIADEEDSGNTYVFNMTIKDNSGQTLMFSEQSFIANTPTMSLGSAAETRDWMISSVSMRSFVGGNTKMDDAAVQAVEALGGTVDSKWRV